MVCVCELVKSLFMRNWPVPNITNDPLLRGYVGFSVTRGGIVMGCMLPLESLAWNNKRTDQLDGVVLETSTAHKFPCRSPA